MKFGKPDEIKLYGITITYNDEKMIPYIMPYYSSLGYDKLYVYDNMSTDSTVELLKEYPFVEVVPYDTGGKFDDRLNTVVKLKCIDFKDKGEKVWCTIGDFDEVIYCNTNFKELLWYKTEEGYNYYSAQIIEPVSMKFPEIRDNGEPFFVHKYMDKANLYSPYYGCKLALLYVTDVVSLIGSYPGFHQSEIVFKSGKAKNFNREQEMLRLHLKNLDMDYLLDRSRTYLKRDPMVSDYEISKKDEDFIKTYNRRYYECFDFKQYLMFKKILSDVSDAEKFLVQLGNK